ncbi:hypothetical protein TEA_023360 [Camellia sinensis var. sinensis]|uniref:Uncharacterized protein n=1 Tax=Camellia sinensis var. sinensis TaxID=542762 RepID=A0A4S4E4Y8_CAMSN|nr:hypothetical protein TEA_023360 [Camellia sinensis var. sinensis]
MNTQKNKKQKHGGGGGQRMVKVAMGLMGVCLAGYIIVPPLYWHISEALASLRRSSCPPCLCDCSSQPFLSLSEGLNNSIFTDTVWSCQTVVGANRNQCRDSLQDHAGPLEKTVVVHQGSNLGSAPWDGLGGSHDV